MKKTILEEKLTLSEAAYNDTKQNLENSDRKLAECAATIDDLKVL